MRSMLVTGAAFVALAAARAFADDVHVMKGPLPAVEGVTIHGFVFASSQAPRGPLTVTLTRREVPMKMSREPGEGMWAFEARDGDAFRFDGLVPGEFYLEVSGEGLATTTRKIEAFADSVNATIHVPLACTARIHASRAEGDVEKTIVFVSGEHGFVPGRPSADGLIEVPALEPGRFRISAGRSTVEVDLAPGTNDVDLHVPAPAGVRFSARSARTGEDFEGLLTRRFGTTARHLGEFRVTADEDGAPLVSDLRNVGGVYGWQTPTRDVGIDGLGNGDCTLAIDAPGFAAWKRDLTVKDGTKIDAVLTPLPGRFVRVVRQSDVDRRLDLLVYVRPASGGRWTPLFERHSFFMVDHAPERAFLAPGRYLVSETTPDTAPSDPQTVEVTSDRSTIELSFEHRPGHTLTGRARTRAGDPVGGFELHCFLRDGDEWRSLKPKYIAVDEGAFEVRGLGTGTYLLTYDAAGVFPLGKFVVGDEDVAREFVVSRRPDPSAEEDASEHVVKGPLTAEEGYVIAGTVVGDGKELVHLQLGRSETDPVCQHGLAWSWRTVDLAPGERFRFVGVPPGEYRLWTEGRRVERLDVFEDHIGLEFRVMEKRLNGVIRPAFETKGERMTIEFRPVGGEGETRFQVVPGREFRTPPLALGRHAVEIWWIQQDGFWVDDPHRWAFVDVTPQSARFDFEFAPAADVTLSVRSTGLAETFEGGVVDADLPEGAAFHFRAEPEGTCTYQESVFGAAFGRPKASVPFLNVTRGTHRFRFVAPGFETLERTVEVGDGTTAIDVALTPIPGTFVVAEGPGHIFEVFARPAAGGPWRGLLFGDNRNVPTHTEPDRPRELLAPGKWEFVATSGDLAPSAPKTYELGADHEELIIALECVPGATLRGTLRTKSGVALTDTETYVFVKDDTGWRRLRAKAPLIDERGEFAVKGLAPGTYRLAFDEAGRHVVGEFDVGDADVKRDFVFAR